MIANKFLQWHAGMSVRLTTRGLLFFIKNLNFLKGEVIC